MQLSRILRSKFVKPSYRGLFEDRFRTAISRPITSSMSTPFSRPASPSTLANDHPPGTQLPTRNLRRMSASHNDLRRIAKRQNSNLTIPLLPSPIEKEVSSKGNSYFQFHNPRECVLNPALHDTPLDTFAILSYYCDEQDTNQEEPDANYPTLNCSDPDSSEDDCQSTCSESMPLTPLDQNSQSALCSDESDWLANTTSHEERMRRFKTRYYQVVEQHWTKVHTDNSRDEVVRTYLSSEALGRVDTSIDDCHNAGWTWKGKAGSHPTPTFKSIKTVPLGGRASWSINPRTMEKRDIGIQSIRHSLRHSVHD